MVSPRGKRSPESTARRYILDKSFHDPIMAETISRVTDTMIIAHLDSLYPGSPPVDVDVVRGEVLLDSRGRGSFQK